MAKPKHRFVVVVLHPNMEFEEVSKHPTKEDAEKARQPGQTIVPYDKNEALFPPGATW